MKDVISFIAFALLFAVAAGCSGNTVSEVPCEAEKESLQRESLLSAFWLRNAADRAVRHILTDRSFLSYVQRHKVAGKMPLMKVGQLRNATDNPDLDARAMVDRIADALFKARLVRVVSGDKDVGRSVVAVRDLENDPHFNVKRTPIEAPQLMLTCRISQNVDNKAGSEMTESALLRVEIAELQSGVVVGRASVSWGIKKKRGFLAP